MILQNTNYAEVRNIVLGKLVNKTIPTDFEDLSETLFGEGNCFNSSEVRKRMYGMKALIEIIDRDNEEVIQSEKLLNTIEDQRIELQIERQKFFDQRSALKEIIRGRSRQEELNELLVKAISSGDLPSLEYTPTIQSYSDNDLLVSLNDIHYGACVENYWNTYNSTICKQMMNNYLHKIISIGEQHGSQNCIVWANGDEISGNIHQSIAISNKENVIEQITGVSELISEFLAELSKHFNKVMFMSVSGNHSRIEPNKDKALTSERLDDLISWYIKARLQNFENVCLDFGEKIDDTMYIMDVRGQIYCGVHGDFDGSPSKIQSLQTMVGRPLYCVLSAHLHHNKIDVVQGVKTVMAGSFLGMDDHCVQKRIFGKPEQIICVCDTNGIVCSYDIPLI